MDGDDIVGDEVSENGGDYRSAARNGGLEENLYFVLTGHVEDARPMTGHNLLVGSHDVFAGGDAPEDVVQSGVLTAHQFDYHVDFAVGQNGLEVRCYQVVGNGGGPCL